MNGQALLAVAPAPALLPQFSESTWREIEDIDDKEPDNTDAMAHITFPGEDDFPARIGTLFAMERQALKNELGDPNKNY